jgi:hypothetical protein
VIKAFDYRNIYFNVSRYFFEGLFKPVALKFLILVIYFIASVYRNEVEEDTTISKGKQGKHLTAT